MLFFLLMNKSIFSIQQISLKYKPEERFEPIGYSIFLPDSRIVFISRFVLSRCCHKLMVIDPKSPNNNFSFDYCNSKVFTLELLDNGHIITSPNVSMFDISNPSNIKEYNVTNEYNSSYGYALLPNNEIAIFESVIAAARELGISRQGIDKVVHGTYGRITAGGYKWKFLD